MNKLTVLIILSLIWMGCTSQVRINLSDSIEYYHELANKQDDLKTDAAISKNYTDMVLHEAKAAYYRDKSHQFQDSLFKIENPGK